MSTTNPLAQVPAFVISKVQPSVKRLAALRSHYQGWVRLGLGRKVGVREDFLAQGQSAAANVFYFRTLCVRQGIDADAAINAMESA